MSGFKLHRWLFVVDRITKLHFFCRPKRILDTTINNICYEMFSFFQNLLVLNPKIKAHAILVSTSNTKLN